MRERPPLLFGVLQRDAASVCVPGDCGSSNSVKTKKA